MLPREKLERLEKLRQRLSERTVLVEGKRDAAALAELGLGGRVMTATGKDEGIVKRALQGGQPVVVLTDFDEEGRRKAQAFAERIVSEGGIVDGAPRRAFADIFGVRCVEDAPTALARIQERAGETRER